MRLLLVCLLAVGCSNAKPATDAGGGDACSGACADKNPQGVCYPTDNQGAAVGKRIPNFAFQGYLNKDPLTKTAKGPLQQIKLSDFFDPTKPQVIHILTSAGWCMPCIAETTYVASAGGPAEKYKGKIIFLQGFLQDMNMMASTQAGLDDWITKLTPNITEVLDPNGMAGLASFGAPGTVPFSITIDARSMEIIATGTGWNGQAKFDADMDAAIAKVMSSQPKACGN